MRSEFKAWDLWGVPLFEGKKRDLRSKIYDLRREEKPFWIATVNPEHVMKAVEDRSYGELLNKTDINVMDGVGLLWARELEERFKMYDLRIKNKFIGLCLKLWVGFKTGVGVMMGKHRENLIPGSILMKEMIEEAGRTGKKVFLLGGWGDRAERVAKKFKVNSYELRVTSCRGEPGVSNEEVIKKINKFEPDYLFVAYGMKKQEEWILENKDKLRVGVVMGVGRSFDYYSGDLKMAPSWVKRMGLEWLYSLVQEPSRWRRQLALIRFVGRVIGG